MRTPLIAGNWKMNLLTDDAVRLAQDLARGTQGLSGVEIVVCPAFTVLQAVAAALKGSPIGLGAQNCYVSENGAYTGEISPHMLRDAGCTWTIIGHSERRQYFNESAELLNEKLKFALASGLNVMFCIGETLEQRESGQMNAVLQRHVLQGLTGLDTPDFDRIALAYEPVWAIGTGLTATPEEAEEAHQYVRSLVAEQFGETVAGALRIQYGGSVKPGNAAELMAQPNVDGALVGGASLKAEDFTAIVKAAA